MNLFISTIYSILPKRIRLIWGKIEQSPIGNKIWQGAFWSLSGSLISQGLMLLASIIVARILGKSTYGELGMIRSTINMFTVFAGFGLGLTATKYIAEYKLNEKEKTGKIIGLSTIFASLTGSLIALIIIGIAPFLSEKTINAPHLVNQLRISSIILFFSALNGSQTGILAGYEAFKTIAKISLIAGLFAFPIQIVFTLIWGITGSLIGFGSNFLLLWILNYKAVRKESIKYNIPIIYKKAWDEWRILYKFSLPALLSGLLVSPVIWLCNAMLVNQPRGYEEMAIFDIANQWRNIILYIPSVLSQIVLPLLSGSQNDQKQFISILKINVKINFAISLIMAVAVSLFSSLILKAYGQDFLEGKIVIIILSFTTILISVNRIIGQAIAGIGKMWVGFLMNLVWGLVLFISTYLFLQLGYGAKGLAFGFLISYFIHTILQIYITNKFIAITH